MFPNAIRNLNNLHVFMQWCSFPSMINNPNNKTMLTLKLHWYLCCGFNCLIPMPSIFKVDKQWRTNASLVCIVCDTLAVSGVLKEDTESSPGAKPQNLGKACHWVQLRFVCRNMFFEVSSMQFRCMPSWQGWAFLLLQKITFPICLCTNAHQCVLYDRIFTCFLDKEYFQVCTNQILHVGRHVVNNIIYLLFPHFGEIM